MLLETLRRQDLLKGKGGENLHLKAVGKWKHCKGWQRFRLYQGLPVGPGLQACCAETTGAGDGVAQRTASLVRTSSSVSSVELWEVVMTGLAFAGGFTFHTGACAC